MYFLIAIIVGGIMIGVFKAINYYKALNEIRDTFKDKDTFRVTKENFPEEVARRWKECGYGVKNESFAIFIIDKGNITRDYIIQRFNMNNHCDQIDCWNHSNRLIINSSFNIPALFRIECLNSTLYMRTV